MSHRMVLIGLALAASTASAQAVGPGALAPEVDLPTLAGSRVQLSKLRGHPVVVSFWGTWCPPCREEFPELVRVQTAYGPAGLFVLAVNGRDQELSTKNVQKFVDEFSAPFQVALDDHGRARRSFLIQGLPTTVFIDTGGVVREVHRGPISREELERGLATILKVK
jgi:thiol-disulfide isomerase/thioredoxin